MDLIILSGPGAEIISESAPNFRYPYLQKDFWTRGEFPDLLHFPDLLCSDSRHIAQLGRVSGASLMRGDIREHKPTLH